MILPQIQKLEDYHPLFDQNDVWLPAIQAICHIHHFNPDQLRRVPEGSAIVFVCGELIIKLLPPFWRHELNQDLIGLEKAFGRLPVNTPELIAEGELEDWAYLITRRIPGVALKQLRKTLSPLELKTVAYDQGLILAALHQLDTSGLSGEWQNFVSSQYQNFAENQRRNGLDEKTLELFKQAFDQALKTLPTNPAQVFLHCDLTDEHVLLEEKNNHWKITGLLDFGDLMRGAAVYDLAAPALMLPPHRSDLRRELITGFGQDISSEQLFAVQMLHRFTHLPGLLGQHQLAPTPEAFKKCYCEL